MTNKLSGQMVVNTINATTSIAIAKPSEPMSESSRGTPIMPPILAPSMAVDTARP